MTAREAAESYGLQVSRSEYLLDEVFPNGSTEDKAVFIKEHGDELTALEKRIMDFDVGNEHGAAKEKRQYTETR